MHNIAAFIYCRSDGMCNRYTHINCVVAWMQDGNECWTGDLLFPFYNICEYRIPIGAIGDG